MPINFKLPNGAALNSFTTVDLSCKSMNRRSRSAHLINGMTQHSLLSCRQICDAGYKVLFEKGEAKVFDGTMNVNDNIVMQGQRDVEKGLWTVPWIIHE
jgi:hypothetical protein